ncbi:MAG TPA: 4Fe-4S dicluster domain-containing protein [Thermoanaerobaculia bacterium]|nr:4Fe-4S dicluster domain-containing protein [Thermoanaerobaculia bacterium]
MSAESPLRTSVTRPRVTGFFTDATLCIGCKACEVACKEWNELPDDGFVWSGLSYDNTLALGDSTWRHVQFVERSPVWKPSGPEPSWEFSSDVCKHCEVAGCLESCPTGSIVRTEFGGVYIQPDVCNGCGYCVVSCPFGVVDRLPHDRAFKCTFCYDRQKAGLVPACAKACPTESIRFGDLETLRVDARKRVEELRGRGVDDATVYDPVETSVRGIHAFFLVRGDPRTFNLPPKPESPTVQLRPAWTSAAAAALLLFAGALGAFLSPSRR